MYRKDVCKPNLKARRSGRPGTQDAVHNDIDRVIPKSILQMYFDAIARLHWVRCQLSRPSVKGKEVLRRRIGRER